MVRIYPTWLRWIYKMDLAPTVIISWKAKLDKSINPRGVHIGGLYMGFIWGNYFGS